MSTTLFTDFAKNQKQFLEKSHLHIRQAVSIASELMANQISASLTGESSRCGCKFGMELVWQLFGFRMRHRISALS